MGISKQQANQNREAILVAAEKLFREKGMNSVGLNDLMEAAGFTRGGFYNHFKSKDDLVAAVIDKATQKGAADLGAAISTARAKHRDPLDSEIAFYLSAQHREDIEGGCPLSGFVGEARHFDETAQEVYARGLERNFELFADVIAKRGVSPEEARAHAIAAFSQMVGALLLSRAVAISAPSLSDEIVETVRHELRAASKAHRQELGRSK